jgi:hypothetical protein
MVVTVALSDRSQGHWMAYNALGRMAKDCPSFVHFWSVPLDVREGDSLLQ